MSEKIDYSKGIYDARQLGAGRMFILGVQHMFAMFGATVLVPLLTGLSVSTTLLCAGLGTLLFHLITKKKVPAFLGSSFAYLGGFSIVAPMLADADGNLTVANTKMLPYACAAVAFSGLVYLVASLLISTFGIRRIMKFFPPVVTGPIIISIGLILAPSAIKNCVLCPVHLKNSKAALHTQDGFCLVLPSSMGDQTCRLLLVAASEPSAASNS